MRSFLLTALLTVNLGCTKYDLSREATELSVSPTPENVIEKILESRQIFIELTVTFEPTNALVSRLITASVNLDGAITTLDNSSVLRADDSVVNACTNVYPGNERWELLGQISTLTSGASNRVNADGLNYELAVSDLHGNAVRQYLAGSPMAAGELLLFLNAEDLVDRLMELATCTTSQ